MASRVAFSCFRAVTAFGDLPLGQKALRVAFFPYFLVKAALTKTQTPEGACPSRCTALRGGIARREATTGAGTLSCVWRVLSALRAVTTPYKTLHELPPLEAVDPSTAARARARGTWRRVALS